MDFKVLNTSKNDIMADMRKVGYISLGRGKDENEFSFIKPFDGSGYPRFHLFVRFDRGKEAFFNIHLDQRKSVYKGAKAHLADYEGPVIEKEVDRIRNYFQ